MRYVCIHAHFYQPPRENAWLGATEAQPSAAPFHDWNARICQECYAPLARAHLPGPGGSTYVNTYASISFNVGPTLLGWLAAHDPPTYRAIQAADAQAMERLGGAGCAMAQAYNHLIMPLATAQTKRLQVLWGMADFRHHFGRPPKGMWLPEAAVDLPTLQALADHGIAYTVLAPHQAQAVRPPGQNTPWQTLLPGQLDPRRPYLCRLPEGGSIALFFYDGPTSHAIAFGGLLHHGDQLAERLIQAFDEVSSEPQLVHVATDGESYGHHHPHGEMALAYALKVFGEDPEVTLTSYEAFLRDHPPSWEVQIKAPVSSWSCVHGVERWRADCGCHTGGGEGWSQAWRAPLRQALEFLRDEVTVRMEAMAGHHAQSWPRACETFIECLLEPAQRPAFLRRELCPEGDAVVLWHLLELRAQVMWMFTSCGWFFNDLEGIETLQILEYAARALELAAFLWPQEPLEAPFLSLLEQAVSNHGRTGRDLWEVDILGQRRHDQVAVAASFALLGPQAPTGWQTHWAIDWHEFRVVRGVHLAHFTLWPRFAGPALSTSWSLVAETRGEDFYVQPGDAQGFEDIVMNRVPLDRCVSAVLPRDVLGLLLEAAGGS